MFYLALKRQVILNKSDGYFFQFTKILQLTTDCPVWFHCFVHLLFKHTNKQIMCKIWKSNEQSVVAFWFWLTRLCFTPNQNNLYLLENRCLANLSMMYHFQNNHHSFLMPDIGWDVLNPESTFDFHFGMMFAKYVRLCCKTLIGRKNGPIEGREHMTFGWNCLGHNKKVCKWSLKKYYISEHYFHFLIETPKFLVRYFFDRNLTRHQGPLSPQIRRQMSLGTYL